MHQDKANFKLKDVSIGEDKHTLAVKNENGVLFLIFDDYDFVINIEKNGISLERRCGEGDDNWEALSVVQGAVNWSKEGDTYRIEFGPRRKSVVLSLFEN